MVDKGQQVFRDFRWCFPVRRVAGVGVDSQIRVRDMLGQGSLLLDREDGVSIAPNDQRRTLGRGNCCRFQHSREDVFPDLRGQLRASREWRDYLRACG